MSCKLKKIIIEISAEKQASLNFGLKVKIVYIFKKRERERNKISRKKQNWVLAGDLKENTVSASATKPASADTSLGVY